MNLKEAAQQALEYLEQHAIISGIPIRDALLAALEPVTTCHELSKEGDKLSLPFNHFPDAGKMVATGQESRQVEPVGYGVFEDGNLHDSFRLEHEAKLFAAFKGDHAEVLPLYTAPPKHKPLTDHQYEALVGDLSEWSRYVEVDTAHQTLARHIREVLTAHGIKGEA